MIKLKSILIEVMKKKSVNENLALGILATLSGIIIGKIAFYYIGQLVEKGIKYFNGSKETEKESDGIEDEVDMGDDLPTPTEAPSKVTQKTETKVAQKTETKVAPKVVATDDEDEDDDLPF
jgi:hypothetical protein